MRIEFLDFLLNLNNEVDFHHITENKGKTSINSSIFGKFNGLISGQHSLLPR